MKIKPDLEISTSEPWYDLAEGGYLKPFEICADVADAQRVTDAVKLVQEFFRSCEDNIEGFLQ